VHAQRSTGDDHLGGAVMRNAFGLHLNSLFHRLSLDGNAKIVHFPLRGTFSILHLCISSSFVTEKRS
jgi:hypothetical protein